MRGLRQLVATVSNAGRLGILTAVTLPNAQTLGREIKRCRMITNGHFKVTLTILPLVKPPSCAVHHQAIIKSGVKVVETEGRNPRGRVVYLRRHGIALIHKRTSIRHALSVERMGVDEISADGFDRTGNAGSTMSRVPCSLPLPRASFAELSRLKLHV